MAYLKPDRTFDFGGVKVNEYLLTKHNPNHISMPTETMTNVIGVTIHNTDWISVSSSTTPAEQYTRATVNGNMNDVRVHYYVDNVCAWQNLPLTLHGWHAADGRGDGNMKTIAIECLMSPSYNNTDKKSEDNCAKLAAALLNKYNFGIDRLFTHNHWYSRKYCPAYILPHWNSFKNKVAMYLAKLKGNTTSMNTSTNTNTTNVGNKSIAKGDLVTINSGATYYNGENIPSWVKKDKWYISSISGDRAVLGLNEAKNSNIQSPINTKFISVIKTSSTAKSYTVNLKSTDILYTAAGGNTKGTVGTTGVFTIVDETTVNGCKYGKLKSGAGWVKLSDDTIIRKGSLVSLKSDAIYYNGSNIPTWVKSQKWYVSEISGDRAVLGQNEKRNQNIQSPINTKYLY